MWSPTPSTPNDRRGHSLLEIVLASALMAITLVPALRLMRDAFGISRQIETCELLTTLSTSKLEEHLALSSSNWESGDYVGDFSAEGYPSLRFHVHRSDSDADGGIADQLMAVTSTAWEDLDGGGSLDADELAVTLSSKVARLTSYQQ